VAGKADLDAKKAKGGKGVGRGTFASVAAKRPERKEWCE
jgi:hypothetical protein